MSGIEVPEADNGELACAICMADLKGSNYGLTDDPSDIGAKCCVVCIKQLAQHSKVSLIGRVPIKGYTIYDAAGKPLQTYVVGNIVGNQVVVQAPDVVIMMPNSNPVINNYIYQGPPPPVVPIVPMDNQPVVSIDQPLDLHIQQAQQAQQAQQPQVQQVYHYQAYQPVMPAASARSRICGDCNRWMKLNAVIIGIIWITGMVVFSISWTASMGTELRYGMLGMAFGALLLGIIIHGVLEWREINRRYQQNVDRLGI